MNPEKFIFYIKIKIRIEDLRLESINFVGFAGNSQLLGLTLQTVMIQKSRRKKAKLSKEEIQRNGKNRREHKSNHSSGSMNLCGNG